MPRKFQRPADPQLSLTCRNCTMKNHCDMTSLCTRLDTRHPLDKRTKSRITTADKTLFPVTPNAL